MAQLSITKIDSPFPEPVKFTLGFDPANLSSAELFRWFVEPELLQRWWAEQATVDPVVGGDYTMHWQAIDKTMTGTITELVPGERLAFTWDWADESEARAREVVVQFGDGTASLTHGPYDDTDEDRQSRQDHLDGWSFFFTLLVKELAFD